VARDSIFRYVLTTAPSDSAIDSRNCSFATFLPNNVYIPQQQYTPKQITINNNKIKMFIITDEMRQTATTVPHSR